MLTGKTIVLAVTGSIAAYKIPNLARMLVKAGAQVHVLMTKNACNFITPITFETLTGTKCLTDTFDRNFEFSVEHVSIAKMADAVLIAPATANVIGKLANGIADDMLTTTITACSCKKLLSPVMNHNMLHNPIVQDNISKLARFGYEVIPPDSGMLANGDSGDGRMPEERVLFEHILRAAAFEKDMMGLRVLVTAGGTMESIDPVRYITNRSTGKMGFALARAAMLRGAEVTLISAHTEAEPPLLVKNISVRSAEEMFEAVCDLAPCQDIIIKAAAVADYRPAKTAQEKIKKSSGSVTLELTRTEDILKFTGEHKKPGQLICGFSMETENVIENSRRKLIEKKCDMICANSLRSEGAGFASDTNIITMITSDGMTELPLMHKEAAAHKIYDRLLEMRQTVYKPDN